MMKKPLVLMILDGFGINNSTVGNAIHSANTPNIDALMAKYSAEMKTWERIPDALAGSMGNQMYLANFKTEEEMWAFYNDAVAEKSE